MAEKIELIPASELPVAEGDEVDVLCVENGELKRKEGASLGGGNNAETSDLVIGINGWGAGIDTSDNITFVEGNINNVLSAFSEGRTPVVKFRFFMESQSDYCYYGYECYASVYRYGSELYVGYIYPGVYNGVSYSGYIRFTLDGQFEVHHSYMLNGTQIQ